MRFFKEVAAGLALCSGSLVACLKYSFGRRIKSILMKRFQNVKKIIQYFS